MALLMVTVLSTKPAPVQQLSILKRSNYECITTIVPSKYFIVSFAFKSRLGLDFACHSFSGIDNIKCQSILVFNL